MSPFRGYEKLMLYFSFSVFKKAVTVWNGTRVRLDFLQSIISPLANQEIGVPKEIDLM
ncbi:MAG: hypothetical protein WCO98_10795 [bacterium]